MELVWIFRKWSPWNISHWPLSFFWKSVRSARSHHYAAADFTCFLWHLWCRKKSRRRKKDTSRHIGDAEYHRNENENLQILGNTRVLENWVGRESKRERERGRGRERNMYHTIYEGRAVKHEDSGFRTECHNPPNISSS